MCDVRVRVLYVFFVGACLYVFTCVYGFTRATRACAVPAPTRRAQVGKYLIQLCGTTPCMVCGSEEIKATIEKHLGIKEGGASQGIAG